MDWRVRIIWWLLGALLLVSTFSPAEADRGFGGRGWWPNGGGSWGSGGHGSSSTWRKNRDYRDTQTYQHITSKHIIQSGTKSKSADSPQQPPYSPSYPSHQSFNQGHLTPQTGYFGNRGYMGYQNHPTSSPGSQGHYAGYGGYDQHYAPASAGGGYYGHRQGYASSQGFGHYPTGRGSQWSPPGYTPSHTVMPGLFDSYGGRGSLSLTSYHSVPFGYSKNFFRPNFPTIINLPMLHYHYPSDIPPRTTWGCDCYVKDQTAVCTYKLEGDLIPSCVNSSITAVFIQSEEVEWLPADTFRHVPDLEYINITGTMVRSLPSGLFHYNRDLKHLLVQNNHDLSSLDSDVFRDASNLEDVILDRNDITSLERDVFTPLTNVKRLNLAYNKFRSLPEGIFRNNQQLQELVLSGNALHISSDTARDMLINNAKLRVLLMRKCKLEDLPPGLLTNASNLEWLDLSRNKISKFPSEFIQDCMKLTYLGLAYNKLKVFGSDVLYQLGGSLATLDLEGNPWHCDCDILPLATWATLRKDAVPGRPKCSSPKSVEKESLQRWFHSEEATRCGGAATLLCTDLNRLLSVARALAEQEPSYFANLLPVSDNDVSFTATNYFLYATAARTDAEVYSMVWHWMRFLEKVLDRRHVRYIESAGETGFLLTISDRHKLALTKLDREGPLHFTFNFSMDPLATTTRKPPAARDIEHPLKLKGFEPLVNFTYIMKHIPENMTKVVDDGIEEELKILFGVISGTNATSPNATAAIVTALNSTGLSVTAVSSSGTALPPKELNATEQMVAGLRTELREVLSTLLLSIDRAKWDAAYQKFVEREEEKAQKSPRAPQFAQQPKPHAAVMNTRVMIDSAESCILIQPQLTVLIAFLTLLVYAIM